MFGIFWASPGPRWPETDSPRKMIPSSGVDTQSDAIFSGVTFKNEKWPRNRSPGHGFECRPLNRLSFFAENPFPATPGPGEAQKSPKITRKIPQQIQTFKNKKYPTQVARVPRLMHKVHVDDGNRRTLGEVLTIKKITERFSISETISRVETTTRVEFRPPKRPREWSFDPRNDHESGVSTTQNDHESGVLTTKTTASTAPQTEIILLGAPPGHPPATEIIL